MVYSVQTELGGRTLTIETGRMARQAGGSVTVRYGDTIVLVTATGSKEPREGLDYFPLTVDYIEKTFAAGKIPGGFFKREGRPSEQEVLTSRFIDRPIRPLFKIGYRNDTQVIATVLSADNENDADFLAMIGASAALTLSPIPFLGPIGGLSIGRINGELVCNPTPTQMAESDIDLIVAASRDAVVMVEGGAREVSEADLVAAIRFAHEQIQPVLRIQEELRKKCNAPAKWEVAVEEEDKSFAGAIREFAERRLKSAIRIPAKLERYAALDQLKKDVVEKFVAADDATGLKKKVEKYYGALKSSTVRQMVLSDGQRIDGRGYTDIRPITIETGLLPRTHGSSLFTRGETQALVTTTLGTSDDQQLIDSITGEYYKRFMLHYNFPPFSVGEVKFLRSPGRREIGHGALAERAIKGVLPDEDEFPYTVRVVSEILESNGSSSMATVCGASLALMDAGVPIKSAVAGVAMGLIAEDGKAAILSDILGDEDHLGDMDFKVAGTSRGITALQMDIKITGLSQELFTKALNQAREGRMFILGKMHEALAQPRAELSPFAPKITTIKIDTEKIGALIGPGGKTIRGIQEATGAKVDVDEDGTVHVAAVDQEAGERAVKMVKAVTATPEIGKFYRGTVQKIMEFGAFVEILPGTDGLVHISQLASNRVKQVEDVLKEGDEIIVKVLEVDPKSGKIRLSLKEALGYTGDLENA